MAERCLALADDPFPGSGSGVLTCELSRRSRQDGNKQLIQRNHVLTTFDIEPGENATLTGEYHITPEDRESPFLVNEVNATGHSYKNGRATTTALAAYAVLLELTIKITSFGERIGRGSFRSSHPD